MWFALKSILKGCIIVAHLSRCARGDGRQKRLPSGVTLPPFYFHPNT